MGASGARIWPGALEFQDWETPQRLEAELSRSTVRAGALVAGLAAALFGVFYALNGPSQFVPANAVAAVCLFAIAAIRARDATVPLYIAVTVGLLLFGYQQALLGRIDNGVSVWLLVPNMAALILGARRLAIYCATVTVVELVGVVVAARNGWLQAQAVIPEPDLVMASSMISVLGLSGIFAFIAVRARRQLMRTVEARNTALAQSLEETRLARNAAIEAARVKERFFANLTHEIRTPLSGISGTAEMIRQTALSDEQRPLADALASSTQSLVELVNAMLDHAKLSANHVGIDRSPMDVRQFGCGLENLFRARASDKGLDLKVAVASDAPGWIETDGVKLRQIVNNLVSNAIKFTARGSVDVSVRCEPSEAAGGLCLVVEVADTGAGIPSDRISAVFEPFVQGDTSISRTYGGTGLGLAIARQLAELLEGSLSARSRPGEGSTFTLILPVRPAQAPVTPSVDTPSAPRAELVGTRVLLAEDNAVNRTVACAMLDRLGANVQVAADGRQAVDLACEGEFDVILMDLQMPVMDGIEATREVRRREQLAGTARVPILAVTGNSPEDYGEACAQAGVDGFIVKPLTFDQLKSVLAKIVGRA